MRLLYRQVDGKLALTHDYINEEDVPDYAILSHTWLESKDEVTYNDVVSGKGQHKLKSYEKIEFCAQQGRTDGLQYFWIDACCINKASSQEAQTAINSMFRWYRKASKCYVYLVDVSATRSAVHADPSSSAWESAFRRSKWFTRGSTLQELLAPSSVEFFSVEGVRLGDKGSLQRWIHEITGIPQEALLGEPLANFSVEKRFSWANNRQTTHVEDRAYSLLGIFAIFMPLIYGEGDHAFTRLREEIQKKSSEAARLDHLLDSLPTSPSAAFNSLENQYGSVCLPNTRVELLQDIKTWAHGDDDRNIYWLSGTARTGKSAVARTVARLHHDEGNLGGSFFFSDTQESTSHATLLFTTLASQLASRIAATRRPICNAIEEHKDISQQGLRDQWEELIINPLSKVDPKSCPSTIVFVLDALDECKERDIAIILRLFAMTKTLKAVRLRILITSRPETSVRSGFQQIPQAERQGFVLHDISLTSINRDLTLYVESNLSAIREERGLSSQWPGSEAVAQLVDISGGLFIWASADCSYIRDGGQFAMKRITRLVNGHRPNNGPEKELDRIYAATLRRSIRQHYDDEEKAELRATLKKVLGAIVILVDPLSVRSLSSLLAMDANEIKGSLEDLQAIIDVSDEDGNASHPIHRHHYNLRDFIFDKDRCIDPDFWIDERSAHQIVAESCLDSCPRI